MHWVWKPLSALGGLSLASALPSLGLGGHTSAPQLPFPPLPIACYCCRKWQAPIRAARLQTRFFIGTRRFPPLGSDSGARGAFSSVLLLSEDVQELHAGLAEIKYIKSGFVSLEQKCAAEGV